MEPTQSKGQTYIHIVPPNTLDRGKALVGSEDSETKMTMFGGGLLTLAESILTTGKKASLQTRLITKFAMYVLKTSVLTFFAELMQCFIPF